MLQRVPVRVPVRVGRPRRLGIGTPDAADVTDADTDAQPDEGTPAKKPLSFLLSFFAINILVFLYSLDATSLAVAIPAIASELHGTTLESFWAGIAYFLGLVVSQPLYASVSDVFGRKPPLYFAFLLFFAGSLTFSLARNMAAIIAGRIIQGLGGGGLDVLGEIIVADMTSLRERPLYLGIMALPIAIGSIIGPTIGALFSDFVTWRWIGWINLPFLGIACPLLVFFLHLRPLDGSLADKASRLDWGGMALFTVGCTVFVLPLSWAGALFAWNSWQTILPLLLGAAVLVVFAFYESRPESPVVPHKLFRSRTLTATLCGAFLHGAVLYVLLQYLPLFFQAVSLESRIGAALLLLPTCVISVVTAIASVIAIGPGLAGYRYRIWASWALVTLGTSLLALMNADSSDHLLRGVPVIWGAGIGALLRLLHLPLQASVPDVNDTGHAIALQLTFRCLGGLVGLAVGSTIFSSTFAPAIASAAARLGGDAPAGLAPLLFGGTGGADGSAHDAIAFIPALRELGLPPATLAPVLGAYLAAMRAVFYAMIGFAGLGLLTSLLTQEFSLNRIDRGRQRFEA
ncbi:MFS general substrate transporter [Durotheca rogersii]|uniref:MFS general substrate transporter n=1 Tax=Durotheca rogersii TaxID=419775 RepID=UPI002220666C|nr:MFS general substrate transporter [Durotheca rogersii]KAI5868184.1 MFS general substrate transporter [Durotheca rogersii]